MNFTTNIEVDVDIDIDEVIHQIKSTTEEERMSLAQELKYEMEIGSVSSLKNPRQIMYKLRDLGVDLRALGGQISESFNIMDSMNNG